MLDMIEPTQTISPKAITVWRIKDTISTIVKLALLATLLFAAHFFHWFEWVYIIIYILLAITFVKAIINIVFKPVYLQRTWRYEIEEDFIQLKSGFLHREHVVIPMSRVEYVTTNEGPLLRKFHLADVTIGTIASSHRIPALPLEQSKQLRIKIAYLAKIKNDVDNAAQSFEQEKVDAKDE